MQQPPPPGPGPSDGREPAAAAAAAAGGEIAERQERIEHPGKLLRLAMMVREMLEEVRRAPLDQGARTHLRDVHERVVTELKEGLSGHLVEELERITLPLNGDDVPSDAEIRIAQAQLLGWLEGLFQGIQAAIATQQIAAAQQLEEMRRRGLPPVDARSRPAAEAPPGQYL